MPADLAVTVLQAAAVPARLAIAGVRVDEPGPSPRAWVDRRAHRPLRLRAAS
jgi:hypothetical protein